MTKTIKARYGILAVSLLLILGFGFLPAPAGMTQSAMRVIGIFLGTLLLWLTVSIDWPSLLCMAALAAVPELGVNAVLSLHSLFSPSCVPMLSPRPPLYGAAQSGSYPAAWHRKAPGSSPGCSSSR